MDRMDEGKGVFVNDSQGSNGHAASEGTGFHVKKCSSEKTELTSAEGSSVYVANHGKLLTNSNGSREELDSTSVTTLPVNLTTPPLTPPREHSVSEPPMNVNRNNVADSVHAKTTRFSATVREGAVIGNGIAEDRYSEGHRLNGGPAFVPSHVNTEPPALVVMTDEEPQEDAVEQQGVEIGEESQVTAVAEDGSQVPGENQAQEVPWTNSQRKARGEAAPVKVGGSSQSLVASSTEEGHTSSEDEEIEEMDLVLVEEGEEEEEGRSKDKEAQLGKRSSGVTSMEAESSTLNYPQSTVSSENGRVAMTARTPTSTQEMNSHVTAAAEGASTGSRHPEMAHTTNNFVKTGLGEHERLRSNHHGSMTPPASSTSQNDGGRHGENGKKENGSLSDTVCSRRAAKVKQFFSTIQQCANGLGRDVAEQVQELIHAVMNGTATAEEFHQEIQTVTNYPLKSFTIPFIKDNIKYLQAELKDSAQALSDILGTVPNSSTVALTPQADEDDELPVLPSSSKSMTLPTIRTVSSTMVHNNSFKAPTPSTPSSSSSFQSSSSISRSVPSQSVPSYSVSSPSHGSGTMVQARSLSATTSTVAMGGPADDGFDSVPRLQGNGVAAIFGSRKRLRKLSMDKGTSTVVSSGESQVISTDKQQVQGSVHLWPTKRTRSEVSDGLVIVTNPRPPPSFPHPPPPPPPTTHIVSGVPVTRPSSADKQTAYSPFPPQDHLNNRRRGSLLSEDWGHLDMMLNSVQGMVERTRQSLASLKDRVHSTHAEMERKEVDHDHIIQQRVAEAVEKTRRQASEERQRLLVEAHQQVRDAVAAVRAEIEQKMQQAQSGAIQEALKEANVQTNSKENCWNCGRRATETCSGCNKARYCGAFCQHKDWANHMHHCASGIQGQTEEPIYSGGRALVSQGHQRAVAIPVTLIGRTQERGLRLSQHPEIIIKSEKT